MARPRLHSLDELLDHAEHLIISSDPAGLTLRSLATASGASTGSVYHAFGSKEDLLAQAWLRATARLGALLDEAAESAEAVDAVVAAAIAPVVFTRVHPASAQLFFAQRSDQLFSGKLTPEITAALAADQQRFVTTLAGLARGVWDRKDRIAVEAIATCVVDIPGGIVRRAVLDGRPLGETTEHRIEAAVRGVLALPLDPPRSRKHIR